MTTTKRLTRFLGTAAIVGMTCFYYNERVYAQPGVTTPTVTLAQLVSLSPDEQDLQGFSRIQPACDNLLDHHPRALQDNADLNYDLTQRPAGVLNVGHRSNLYRTLYSSDGVYSLRIVVKLVDTREAARQELQDSAVRQGMFKPGTFDGPAPIGDESLCPLDGDAVLLLRAGRVVVDLEGSLSNDARNSGDYPQFPHAALEAVAYQILLRASQQPILTDVTAAQAQVAVNGHALPKGALRVAGQTYVPVQAFAQAMGLTSRWDGKTGALTLSGAGRKTVALTAGSTVATVGGSPSPALRVPVLKQAGQPVMALDDLLALTGGRVVGREGGTVRVKA